MNMKKRIIILVISLIAITGVIIGVSYAFFSTGGSQETANTFQSGCLNITLADASSSISLTNAYPITDIEGLNTTSYDFTITNTCSTSANYEINLESLNETTNSLSADYIKVSLSSDTVGNVISKLSSNTSTTTNIDNAYEAYNLYTGVLNASETKTYHLKLWIDYDATVEQAANKVYQSKINVIANPDIQVVDNLEATFTLSDKTLTANLTSNVTSATYCTTTINICEPNTNATVSNNSYTTNVTPTTKQVATTLGNINVNTSTPQMVCTKLNGTSKVICSNSVEVGTPNFANTSCTSKTYNGTARTCGEETIGIYEETTSKGTTYYWRGDVEDNYLVFANKYWRIIRINEDGTIRIIYSGEKSTVDDAGASTVLANGYNDGSTDYTQIQTSAFNSSYNNNMYVGYMYTSGSVHGLGTDSTIKGVLDTWYYDNLRNYADDIDTNAGFCGDRTSTTSSSGAPDDTGGTGTTATYYGARYRLYTNKTPTFSCSDASNDLYTISGASQGNKALTYPIGLITADEVAYAGGKYGTTNFGYYLYTGNYYWTLSPCYFYALSSSARVFGVDSDGCLYYWGVNGTVGVRPVINLKADISISGSGTVSDPYIVQ